MSHGALAATSMRRGTSAQVVLLPGGAVGEAVLARVRDWTAEGLLDPVFWVPEHGVAAHHAMPARLTAIVVGRTSDGSVESREVPLLATLGRESVAEVVVTSVRWVTGSADERDRLSAAARRLLAAIRDAVPLPRQVGDVTVGGTAVRSLNLVFASTQVTSSEIAALVSTDWDDNIVVSPEDRQRPNAADRFTDGEDTWSWSAFIAASTASLAGLWTGFAGSPIPRVPGSGLAANVPQVRVARTFARAVTSGAFSIDLARSVAATLAQPRTPLTDPRTASLIAESSGLVALDSARAESIIDAAVGYLMRVDDSCLSYRRLEPQSSGGGRSVRLGRAVGDFARFSVDKLAAIPTWIGSWFADRLGRRTQASLYGDAGVAVDARSDLGLSRSDRDLMELAGAVNALQAHVAAALAEPPLPVTRVAAPTLWTALRGTVFTLVDGGSDVPEIAPITEGDRVAVVPDVGMVIPAPWETWTLPPAAARHLSGHEHDETVVTWTEVSAARDLREHLTERAADLEARLQELEGKHAQSRKDLIAAERDFVEARELCEDLELELEEAREIERFLHAGKQVTA